MPASISMKICGESLQSECERTLAELTNLKLPALNRHSRLDPAIPSQCRSRHLYSLSK
jgi:ADP-ribose pyrophosphatase YjhB (NUDIX family)